MATTTYHVISGDTVIATASKKSKALDAAHAHRDAERAAVSVVTGAGNVVLDLAAPKRIKMSKPYTRVVALPEGVEVPDGARVCYVKARKGFAVLHFAEEGSYAVLSTTSGELLAEGLPTTRAAGRFTTDTPAPAPATA